jgi:hypothetical protein
MGKFGEPWHVIEGGFGHVYLMATVDDAYWERLERQDDSVEPIIPNADGATIATVDNTERANRAAACANACAEFNNPEALGALIAAAKLVCAASDQPVWAEGDLKMLGLGISIMELRAAVDALDQEPTNAR